MAGFFFLFCFFLKHRVACGENTGSNGDKLAPFTMKSLNL